VARYRLRFVLQEFDLPRGSTVIGRSLDCHLTIEDPLVSRRHARIVVTDTGAHVEDLGSRNGVKVNGAAIRQLTVLRNGDRLRIGTQELVFSRVDEAGRAHSRTTGQLRLCANCRQPYPREMLACPTCEATEQTDDETLTAAGGTGNSQRWTMQLFVEALERALRLGRMSDAEQLARRASGQLDEVLAQGAQVDPHALGCLASQVAAMTIATGECAWALWALDVYGRIQRIPPVEVIERVAEAAALHPDVLRVAIVGLVARLRAAVEAASAEELDALLRLEDLVTQVALDQMAWR
jgi:hypothetical protein